MRRLRQDGLLADDLGVMLDVARRGHGFREGGEVGHAADHLEAAAAFQLVGQRDEVHGALLLVEGEDGLEDFPVGGGGEIVGA